MEWLFAIWIDIEIERFEGTYPSVSRTTIGCVCFSISQGGGKQRADGMTGMFGGSVQKCTSDHGSGVTTFADQVLEPHLAAANETGPQPRHHDVRAMSA
jgi:hypothetical protein